MTFILNIIKKYWYAMLIVLVLILYIPGFFSSKFAFFGQRNKTKILGTPIVIQEIREVGELVTAEYYGEIYADLNEAFDSIIFKYENRFDIKSDSLFKLYPSLKDYSKDYFAFKTIQAAFNNETAVYETAVKANPANSAEVLKAKKNFDEIQKKYSDAEKQLQKTSKSRNLVYIGRGWVKAGFNFGMLDETKVQVENLKDTMLLQLPRPEILNADINPWFIESKKIKGFEVFFQRGNRFTNHEIAMVKFQCKQKLVQDAIQKGILQKAKDSGKASLENLFSLLKFKVVIISFE